MKLLLVDDDARILETLKRMVSRLGHEADCVNNAVDAARLVQSGQYDFVLLDVQMAGRSGVWFMENAKIPAGTKVLVMSGYAALQDVERMLRLDAGARLPKPFGMDQIAKMLAGDMQPAKRIEARLDHIFNPDGPADSGRTLICMRELGLAI